MSRIICAIQQFRLHENAKRTLSYQSYERCNAWLTSWTAEGNVKAVIANNTDHAVVLLRQQCSRLIPSWLTTESGITPKDLQFTICFSDLDDDGSFWRKLQLSDGKWHDLSID